MICQVYRQSMLISLKQQHTYAHVYTCQHPYTHLHFPFKLSERFLGQRIFVLFLLVSKFLTKQNCTHKVVCHRSAAHIKIPGMLSGGFLTGVSLTFCIVTVVLIYARNTPCRIIGGHDILHLQKRQTERNLTFGKLSEKGGIHNNTWGNIGVWESFEDNLKKCNSEATLRGAYIYF